MPLTTTWVKLEIIIISEIKQEAKDKYHMISLMCRISTITQMNLSLKQKQNHRHRKQIVGFQVTRIGGSMEGEIGVSRYKLLYTEWVNNKVQV